MDGSHLESEALDLNSAYRADHVAKLLERKLDMAEFY